MSEVPFINLEIGDERLKVTPYNSRLFTFVGRQVMENGDSFDRSTRNHVYVLQPKEDVETSRSGAYFFGADTVQQLGTIMLRNNFPASLNNWVIPDCDEEAYQRWLEQNNDESATDIPDSFPEDWT